MKLHKIRKTVKLRIKVQCKICGKEEDVCPSRFKNYCTCSRACNSIYLKNKSKPNTICPVCNKEFHCKPYHLKRCKTVCCSRECDLVMRQIRMSGSNNHQYGLKGSLNASYKTDFNLTHYKYIAGKNYLKIQIMKYLLTEQ